MDVTAVCNVLSRLETKVTMELRHLVRVNEVRRKRMLER